MNETIINLVGRRNDLLNPGCSCGGASCEPSETLGEAVENLGAFLSAEGFRNVSVHLADPEDAGCDPKMKELFEGHRELLPLTVINGKITFYSGLRKDMLLKVLKKLGAE